MTLRRTGVAVASVLFAGLGAAQSTWIVSPGNPANLQNTINQASPGDELLVQPGTYDMFSLTKGLTVRALQPGTVTLQGTSLYIFQVPVGQHAHLIGLECPGAWSIGGGTTAMEDCTFSRPGVVLSIAFGAVHLERCVVTAEPFWIAAQAAISVSNGMLTAVDTVIRGANSGASPAVAVVDATMIGTGLQLEGGAGVGSASAVVVTGASSVRLSDSIVIGGGTTCAITGANAECDRCTLSNACGLPAGTMLGMWANGAVERGQAYTLHLRGEPNAPVLLFGSNEVDVFATPQLQLPFLLASAGCFPAAALHCDGTGQASISWQLPSATLPPAVGLWFQGVSGTSFPLSASTVVGGMVR